MAKQLKNVKNIRLVATIDPFAMVKQGDFLNYFRTFKKPEENVEENHFCSPFFLNGSVLNMHEHYGERINAMQFIVRELRNKRLIAVYLCYDFKLAAVNEEYYTDGEFLFMKWLIEGALKETGLYLSFMVSHFNQLVGNPLYRKPEHYHLLICSDREMDDFEYDIAVNRFAENLRRDWIKVVIEE